MRLCVACNYSSDRLSAQEMRTHKLNCLNYMNILCYIIICINIHIYIYMKKIIILIMSLINIYTHHTRA